MDNSLCGTELLLSLKLSFISSDMNNTEGTSKGFGSLKVVTLRTHINIASTLVVLHYLSPDCTGGLNSASTIASGFAF